MQELADILNTATWVGLIAGVVIIGLIAFFVIRAITRESKKSSNYNKHHKFLYDRAVQLGAELINHCM